MLKSLAADALANNTHHAIKLAVAVHVVTLKMALQMRSLW